RGALVVAQIALSFTLAVGAGLLFRSFLSLSETDLGVRTEALLVMYAHAPAPGLGSDLHGATDKLAANLRAARFFDELSDRIRQLPGAISAAGVMGLPTGQYGSNGGYAVAGQATMALHGELPWANFSLASPGYFVTAGIPLLRGRDFSEGDQYGSEPVVIVS